MLRIASDFTITVVAAPGVLTVTVRFPAMADRRVVEACMAEIAGAFGALEPLTEVELRGLYWRQQQVSDTEDSVQLRKPFTDPDYPQKFDAALKATRLKFRGPPIH